MHQVFICYVRTLEPQVSALRDALERALRTVYRRDAKVFQDVSGLETGDVWRARIVDTLNETPVLLVIVTPTIFESKESLLEINTFADKQEGTIIPLIVEETRALIEPGPTPEQMAQLSEFEADQARALQIIKDRNFEDFKEFIFADPTSENYLRRVTALARVVRDRIEGAPEFVPAADGDAQGQGARRRLPLIAAAGALAAAAAGAAYLGGVHCPITGGPGCAATAPISAEWRQIAASSAVAVDDGDFFAQPDAASQATWPIYKGNRYVGPIYENVDAPNWYRFTVQNQESFGQKRFFELND